MFCVGYAEFCRVCFAFFAELIECFDFRSLKDFLGQEFVYVSVFFFHTRKIIFYFFF